MNTVLINQTTSSTGNLPEIKLTLSNDPSYYLTIDNRHFEDIYKYTNEASSSAFDFYILGVIIYNIDRLIPRKQLSLDGWCREISFKYEVQNVSLWSSQQARICEMLNFLTGDIWDITFLKRTGLNSYNPSLRLPINNFKPDKVCLFSGGLDSLIGGYELLKNNNKTLLVSHYDSAMSGNQQQKAIKSELEKQFIECSDFEWTHNHVGVRRGSNGKKLEATFRSRSILFISIAAYLAHNLTPNQEFHIPENGTISLNIPLSPSRRSSCSTKTTHPYVLFCVNNIFVGLGINTSVKNPFEFKTKGEMLLPYSNDIFLRSLVEISNSCGKGGHTRFWYKFWNQRTNGVLLTKSPSHCGKCMPCIYRRAATNRVGWDNGINYGDNIFESVNWIWATINPKNKRMKDVKIFLQFLSKKRTKEEIKKELLINGSLPLDKLDQYADVVVRTIDELETWINDNNTSSNYLVLKNLANL